ncbi:hypothetical protein B296_00007762 [Ensete ventricosum]|uniref:Uncharacterized protein n=1 Tax=Ensete ventricosum TaxID=4639 RepID=A0A427B8Y4_ENSVE|nr:hypothetical protein B296_00007762 [Ensete ventricosum]
MQRRRKGHHGDFTYVEGSDCSCRIPRNELELHVELPVYVLVFRLEAGARILVEGKREELAIVEDFGTAITPAYVYILVEVAGQRSACRSDKQCKQEKQGSFGGGSTGSHAHEGAFTEQWQQNGWSSGLLDLRGLPLIEERNQHGRQRAGVEPPIVSLRPRSLARGCCLIARKSNLS